MTGTENVTESIPLVSSRRVQVIYPAVQEAVVHKFQWSMRFWLFPGSLMHDEVRCAYSRSEDLTRLGDALDVSRASY
jgi:hypothetical protein